MISEARANSHKQNQLTIPNADIPGMGINTRPSIPEQSPIFAVLLINPEVMVVPQTYTLPDSALLSVTSFPAIMTWQPDQVYVVLGRSNNAESSVYTGRIEADDAMLLKRPSGGEAVVLTPSMLVVACTDAIGRYRSPRDFFVLCNGVLIDTFNQLGITGLSQRGISDISKEGMKIVGSSMYKGSDRLFYHAVINVAERSGTIAWYLKHPAREPDYRQGRHHDEFITSLHDLGFTGSIDDLAQTTQNRFMYRFEQPLNQDH
ncbi:MAG TPA: hypothetical protein DCR43_07450 [Bacteroidales bacterium]|nr:MAG: hypothetical protein A2X11_08100 [Bacteroidetes bacterium GWE2_42_24]OFY30267.1 MAG: hypothetical protein A2X09_12955 [Bacteroidetes bacterium GWF2_43_11]HAQ65670.1 hypothetical protein [Bacteroidales bacterium]HBZ68198.1 hypothetical protein [Bacteroidales bacterium]